MQSVAKASGPGHTGADGHLPSALTGTIQPALDGRE
jgi:hypothetical protein